MYSGIECENSLYLFAKDNWFRKKLYMVYKNKYFDNTIMLLIVLSSIKLASDTYYMDAEPDSTLGRIS